MKEVGKYGRTVYETEYAGQGVSLTFEKTVDERGLRLKSDIKDGNGDYMGHVELNDSLGKAYVDVQNVKSISRKTLVGVFKKISEAFEFALGDDVAAESETTQEEA